jgi:hypothetical protein
MQIYTVEGPDGRIYEVEGPAGATTAQVIAAVRRQIAAQPAAPKPEGGFIAAAKAGATELGGGISALMGKVGLKDEAKAEAEYQAAKKRAAEIFKPTEEGWTEAPLTKFKELLGGSLPYMAAPLAAGAAAATLPVTGTAAALTTLGAAGLTSAGQFTATNLSRQLEEGKKLAETSLGSAAAAAIPQAALDTLSMRMIPGIGRIFGQAGVKITAENAKEIAEQGLKKTLADYAAKTGRTAGIEGATEATQQVFERLQAGLSITDPQARQEYFDSFIGGAVLGGTLAPVGRAVERGGEKRQARGLLEKQAQEERAAAAKAEAERKKSPEYLLGLDTQYNEAVAKVRELQAAVKKKPAKDADPAQWAEYNQKVAELKEFTANTMRPITAEYTPRKAEIAKVKDQRAAEVEAAAAQEIPQEAQKLPYYASAQETIPGLEPVEAAPAAAEETVDYAKQARDLKEYLVDLQTQAKTTTDLDAKLKLSTDYARAEAALKEATRLTKASGQEEGKAIDKLRKQMAVAEDQGDLEAQGRIAQQLKSLGVTDLGAQAELDLGKPQALKKLQVPTDMADYQAAQQRAAEEKAAREAQQRQQQQLAREAYERSQQTAGMYTDVLAAAQRRAADRAAAEAETKAETERTQREEELVGKLVESTGAVQPQPVPQARMALPARETTESLYDQAAELRAQLTFAQQTRNKNLEARVRQQLQQIGASPEEKGSALDLGATAREAGVEGELTPEAMEQNRLMRLGQRQLMSYDQLVKFITQAREREQAAVDEKTKAQYKYRAEQLKQAAIGFALQEINGRRRQYGLPELEHKDAMRAVTGLARPLNELVARGAQIFEEPVVVRGQQRGIRLVEGAQEFERPPAGKRTFSEAGFPAAADTLREQFRQVVETVSGKPQVAPPAPYAKPPGPVRKVVPEQRELFLTPPPAEEPVSLAPEGFFAKGTDKAASADDAQLLRQMQDVYTTLTPQQQSVVREQAQRAADGKPLDAVYEMRGLYQLRQREAATAAGQQTFLKPITLVTARRKIERLAQKTAQLERTAAEAKAFADRVNAGRKTEVERAQAAFDRAREQGKDLIATASQLRMEQTRERLDAANKIAELETKKRALDKEWDGTVAGEFAWLQARYQFLREELAVGRAPKTNAAELAQLEKLYPGAADRVVKASKALDRIDKKIAEAKQAQQEVLERQAADKVTTSLLKQATKAQEKIDAAQQKLSDAREAEKAAERVHRATMASTPKEPTLLSQIEALPITGAVRVFRDTSDPAVQSQATKKRSAIAREEGTYAVLEERIKDAQGDERVKLQKQLNESEERLQKLHDELYDVYGNAPLKRVEGKTVEAAASAERLEKARHEVHSAEIDAFNAKHDTARLSLPARKAGPIISEKGVVKQGGERVIKAEPATPIADIAATRKRIDEINQQFAYIKENPAKSAEGKAKQAKVKTQLAAERQTLGAKLKELLQAQRQVSQEEKAVERELKGARTVSKRAIKQTKLEATDAQLFEDLADAKLSKEQRQLFERAQNAFGEMSAPEQAFVRRQANALVGRREADYKAEALTDVVQTAERRMAREGDIEFSRGKPAEGLTKEELIAELERALGQKGLLDTQNVLIVVESLAELKEGNVTTQVGARKMAPVSALRKRRVSLPPALRDNLDTIPDDAKGFVYDGKAYLIAENIGKDHALGVLLHEVGAHIGFRNFFNTAQYNALVETVKRWSNSKANTLEAKIGRAAKERVEAAKTPEEQVNDELLAYAVEEAFNAGVEPSGVKGGNAVQNWLRMIVDGFKRALEKFGLAPQKLKVGDLVNMAYGAANLELRGTWHGTGKPFKEFDFTYMGSGEGAQVFGWGTYRASAHSTAKFYQRQEAAKQLRQWQNDPKIKEWQASLTENIMFDGRKLSSERDRLQKLIQSSDPDTSRKAFADAYVFDLLARRARENDFKLSPAKIAENITNKGELIGLDNEIKVAAQKTVDSIIAGDLKIVMPFQGDFLLQDNVAYYKNKDYLESTLPVERWMDIDDLVDAAVDEAKDKTYAAVAEALSRVYKEKLASYEKLAKASGYFAAKAADLRKIDVDAIVYHPLPEPPIPEPKGAFARVMSTRPDEEYFVLDLPLDQQAPKVQNAISELLNSTDAVKDKARLRSVLNAKMDGDDRASDLAEALRWIPAKPTQAPTSKAAMKRRSDKAISYLLREYGIAGYKYLDAPSRDRNITRDSKFNYVDFYDKDEGSAIVAWDIDRVGPAEGILFSRNLPTASRVADSLIAKEKGWVTKLKDNFLGMGFRTQFVDKLAPSEEALKRGGTDPTKALQAMYYLRMYDQRMHFTSQSITEGVPELVEKTRRDGTTERLIETKAGANIQQIVDILKGKDVVKAAGSADGANKLFTLYLAAIRGERVGYDTLNFGRVWAEAEVKRIESQLKATTISQEQRAVLQKRKKSLEEKIPTMPTAADIKAARAEIESDPTLKKAFDEARDIYNQYNRNLLEFSVQTGALSREQANEYLRNNDYIPYYRMRDGVAEMVIGNETPIRIGNLKDSPHLQELVGGDEAIFDFLTSSVQNTSMLLDMATKNLATKNLMFELRDVGLATVAKVPKSGKTPEGAVTFKRDGEDHYAVVDTDTIGIDSDLLVKGLAGIPTMFPAFVRVLGVPARLLRRVVVASPVYMARQLFRDSLAAAMTSGADIVPVLGSLKQIGKPNVLQGRGITGGQVFTGMPEDVTRMLKDMQAGKISVTNGLSYLEAKAAQVDALTRKAQYESYLKQGLSEMEATYMALESMNFSKRGLSPGIHMLSTLIPFFNAQIQGLDVLYKAFAGKMPLNERLDVRQKLWERGLMLAGMSMVYAMYMQDDETYENAKPEEKYGNWFVRVPGFEQMVRLPIPFELGYIFKALPEALVNTAMNDKGGEEAMKAGKHIAQQMVPGASSYFLPQAVKTGLEVAVGKSIYTGRDIESTQEQMMEPGYRYRDNTTALAREVGELTGFSPVKMEFLIRGYTGSMGMALLASLSAPFGGEGPEAATKRASDMPVVGTLFQPKDASGIIDATYERMKQVNQVKETYEGLLNKGRQADAEKYLKENIDEMALASVAGSFKQYMGQITEYERQIRASNLTPEKKREALDQARQAKIQLATSVRAATERKAPQAALA